MAMVNNRDLETQNVQPWCHGTHKNTPVTDLVSKETTIPHRPTSGYRHFWVIFNGHNVVTFFILMKWPIQIYTFFFNINCFLCINILVMYLYVYLYYTTIFFIYMYYGNTLYLFVVLCFWSPGLFHVGFWWHLITGSEFRFQKGGVINAFHL